MAGAEEEAKLNGDVLDEILSRVPTLSLLAASHVSRSWRRAVSSSLLRSPRAKPWLVLHIPTGRCSRAYDPHSRAWLPLPHVTPSSSVTCPPLRSSLPSLLFRVSPSRLSLSSHPLAATWRHLSPPRVWRQDPVVALVGRHVIVAGGVCDFEDADPLSVESFDLSRPGSGWTALDPIPETFRESASATWLSVAASGRRLYVLEKSSGRLASLDPETGKWSRTCEIRPDPAALISAVGCSNERLIVAGVSSGMARLYEVEDDVAVREVGRMPAEMAERVAGGEGTVGIGFALEGGIGYLYNRTVGMREVLMWEIGTGRWESVGWPADADVENPMARIVFGCGIVGLEEVKMVQQSTLR